MEEYGGGMKDPSMDRVRIETALEPVYIMGEVL
jgi:hypothetical protein